MYKKGVFCGGGEVSKCRDRLAQYCVGDGLDVGCGGRETDIRFYEENKITPTAIGIDLSRTNLQGKADDLYWFTDECMDYVFSSHLLEHLRYPWNALDEWFRVLKPGGFLVMYLPLLGHYPDVGKDGANRDHKFNLNPTIVLEWLAKKKLKFSLLRIEAMTGGDEYSFDFVVQKLNS